MGALHADARRLAVESTPAVLVPATRDVPPRQLTTSQARSERLSFLTRSLGDEALAEQTLERILGGDELQSVSYLERGAIAARAVGRVAIGDGGFGTGFLIAPGVLITNNHVLADAATAAQSQVQFDYQLTLSEVPAESSTFSLSPERLFYTLPALDFTVVAVEPIALDTRRALTTFGFLPLLETTGKAFEGEWLTIVQHPRGGYKQVCVRENKLLERTEDVLRYSTDTDRGSSGSCVFNNDWYVVALHHSGIAAQKNGRTQTHDGVDFDPVTMDPSRIQWVANEGIRASRIVSTLKQALPLHPLLQPLFAATPASARIHAAPAGSSPNENSRNSVEIPTMQIPAPAPSVAAASEEQLAAAILAALARLRTNPEVSVQLFTEAAKKKPPVFDVPFDDDYSTRKGFRADFLGGGAKRVNLPKLSDSLLADAVPLLGQGKGHVLNYHNFSLVMHRKRRFAIYSAANVSFGKRYEMGRPPDVWRLDPRIDRAYQVENWYYARNNFDRGHLSRREDLEYGDTPALALAAAADTCHWANCTPQHAKFNQNREIWQGIERHVLEAAIVAGHFNAQVITGPVFNEDDPEYREIAYPIQYWKVVAALDAAGALFATAYIASQEEVIDQFGIEAEVPFGPYKTYQVKITEIERLTGLTFTSNGGGARLSEVDPLSRPGTRRRRRAGGGGLERTVAGSTSGYHEIRDLDDIQMTL